MIPVCVPLRSGASRRVVIVPEVTHCMAQYWPAGTVVAVTITAPPRPAFCLRIVSVIGLVYRIKG